ALMSSEYIAGSININPVLVRKEIAELKKAGYVDSKQGKNGGCYLLKDPKNILFDELFKKVYKESIFSHAKNKPNLNCPIGRNINKNLSDLYVDLEVDLMNSLKKISLQGFVEKFK